MKLRIAILAAVVVASAAYVVLGVIDFFREIEEDEHRPRSDDEWDAFARAHAIPEADLL